MKSARIATIVSTMTVILMVLNNRLTAAMVARVVTGAGGPNVGVSLPPNVVILVKLAHFFEDYFYVLIPFVWLATFVIAWLIRTLFAVLKPQTGENHA